MFVQVIEGKTSNPAAIIEQGDRWQQDVRPGAIGYLGVTAGVAADGRTLAIVRFEDEASARANAERPEQTAWFEGMAKLYDGEPTFTESSDVTEWMGGGSNDAGFVQVMKSTGVDRAQVEKMDAAFESFAGQRPDLLGGLYGASLYIARAADPRAARAEVDLVLDTLVSGLLRGATS